MHYAHRQLQHTPEIITKPHSKSPKRQMPRLRLVLLKNKTVPQDAYQDVFSAAGHTPHYIPLLSHEPVSIPETVEYLTSADFLGTSRFIITSQRAVEVFHECLREIEANDAATAKLIRAKKGYTVGPATDQILRENGFVDVRGGARAGNGAKLADIILAEADDSPIVFFTGAIRKDIIPVKLKAHGVSISERVIYKTEPRTTIVGDFLASCETPVDWLVFFSPQGTEDIVAHVQKHGVPGARVASIGPTTEQYLLDMGIKPHVVAAKPTAESLFESIERWELDNN